MESETIRKLELLVDKTKRVFINLEELKQNIINLVLSIQPKPNGKFISFEDYIITRRVKIPQIIQHQEQEEEYKYE